MRNAGLYLWSACSGLLLLAACRGHSAGQEPGPHFSLLTSGSTNIDFNNQVTESDSVNFYTNEYMYIGSGVGVGDFNCDGKQDLFFCGSQVSSRLYLNKGNFSFEDITAKAGVGTHVWCTGVSVIDINNDGWPDIYVCVSHSPDPQKRKNLLFINQGNGKDGVPVFKEEAAEYGLADTGYSTQAVFFDYDKDGDLDMYLENHRLYNPRPNDIVPRDTSGNSPAEDRLYRNEGIPPGMDHPVFKDVTREAGIKEDGYGLGVVVADLNKDGWPDIYVANDYIGNDVLWLNNKDGTFRNVIAHSLRHQSYNSMGVDAADINNDGWPDLAVLDMMPATNERKKIMYAGASPQRYEMERRMGYEPSFTRNMLQLNNGDRQWEGKTIPFFSEIGQLAGVSATDWSWSVLMADFNNDGWKDMYITNGMARDLTNNDFLFYWQSMYQPAYGFGGGKADSRGLTPEQISMVRKELEKYGSVPLDNYLFMNRGGGDLRLDDCTKAAGLDVPSISQGAVYADLDNDGNLDIIVNNMNMEASVWKNQTFAGIADSSHHFLTVELKGDHLNNSGIGAKLYLYTGGMQQYLEQSPVRGYASTVDNRLHFGLGRAVFADSVRIVWPDDRVQVIDHVAADHFITLDHADARPAGRNGDPMGSGRLASGGNTPLLFTDAAHEENIAFKHSERSYFDFAYQHMLPQKYSQLGPPLATADVNGDGLTDFFAGGAAGQPGRLFIQQADGRFLARDLVAGSNGAGTGKNGAGNGLSVTSVIAEDLGAIFFDANGDGSPDLLVTGGSTEFGSGSMNNKPRLYLNDGKGNFRLDPSAIPADISVIAQAVAVGDLDGDGEPDIFIGGRVVAGQYPTSPRSYILHNHHGVFTDVTAKVCPDLEWPGMVTAALWTDFNKDGRPDLLICGEWMPLRFFKNTGGRLEEVTGSTGLKGNYGLWRSLQAVDINHDGNMDYVAGNMGWNNDYHLSAERPLRLYAKDMDNNGIIDLVPAYYIRNRDGDYKLYPDLDRNQLADEVPSVKKKYLLHADFAKLGMDQLKSDFGEEGWMELKCETSSSVWIENKGDGRFVMHELPLAAQFAPVNAILAEDVDGDGNIDLVLGGNEYQSAPGRGRQDASYGLLLKGDGHGSFIPVDPQKSGLILDGDVKALKGLETCRHRRLVLAAVNDDSLRCFKLLK
jgi:hypothetical protein